MNWKLSTWSGWLLIVAGAIVLAIGLPRFVLDMRLALHEPELPGLDERLTNIQPDLAPWLMEQKGGHWARHGWYLAAGEDGSVSLRLPGTQSGRMKFRVWAFDPGFLKVQVSDARGTHEIPLAHLDGRVLNIPVNGPPQVILTVSNHRSYEQLVLDRFAVAWSKPGDDLPSPWAFGLALLLSMVGWGLLIYQRNVSGGWQTWMGCLLILMALAVGVVLRWTLLDIARALPNEPDVIGYREYARSLQWFTSEHGFYSGTFTEREPLHVGLLNLWGQLWGETFPAIRWYTVFLSLLLIAATGTFVWAITKQWVLGGLASWVMALSPAWVDEAVRGLRLESLTFLFLVVLSGWLWTRGWLGAVLLGVTTGGITLLQSPALSVMFALFWGGWLLNLWRERRGLRPLSPYQWRLPHLTLASLLAICLFVPHLYGLYKVRGDPSWPSYGYARWNANLEFPERLGSEGFPTPEEFSRSPYAGPRITYSDYLFRLHSIPKLVLGQIKGWFESTVYMTVSATPQLEALLFLFQASGIRAVLPQLSISTFIISAILLGLTMIGWLNLWRHPQFWWVPFLSLWGTWYVAYLYSVRLVEPFRHTGHVYPLLLFCLLWGGACLYHRLKSTQSPFDLSVSPISRRSLSNAD